jgi:hypothetical protein
MVSKNAVKSAGANVVAGVITYVLVRGVIEIGELSIKVGKKAYNNIKSNSNTQATTAPATAEEVDLEIIKKEMEAQFALLENMSEEELARLATDFYAGITPDQIKFADEIGAKIAEMFAKTDSASDTEAINPDEKVQESNSNQNVFQSVLKEVNSKAAGLGASAASVAKKIHF